MATVIDSGRTPATSSSAVSWPSIFAGAATALGTTLILFALGSGLGFATASPWPGSGPSMKAFAIGTGIWLIVMQWLSSALGGYIAGRLRTRWVGVHTTEVLFRDTAHGLLAWAVSTIIIVMVALSATATTVNAAGSAGSASSAAADTLLRTDRPGDANREAARAEIGRILSVDGPLGGTDRTYLVQVVARQTGVSQAEASQRVDAAETAVRSAADKARKVATALGFFTALSMLMGAFVASAAAGYAGRLRDDAEIKLG